jgi:polar amino acid transport system substrate-binding protein
MKWFWIILIMLFSSSIFSETIKVCSFDRFDLSQKDGSGYYWDLLRSVYEAEGIKLEHSSASFARCLRRVENKEVDAAVAVFKSPERTKKFIYPKFRLNFSSYGLIYLKGTSFNGFENVKSKIGIIRGYDFSAWLPSNLYLHKLKNTGQAMKMLELKRLEYHADDIQDVLLTIKKMGGRSEQFIYKKFNTKNLYIIFTKDPRGQNLADKFDTGLRIVFDNGILEKLIEKYGLINSTLSDFK